MAILFMACFNDQNKSMQNKQKEELMKLPQDAHSLSLPNDCRATHLKWKAKVDFASKIIEATATWTLRRLNNTGEVRFDTRSLNIEEVWSGDQKLSFRLSDQDSILGRALIITIPDTATQVSIRYKTEPSAEALLWVEGETPFLFTQSEAILARTWIPCQDSPGVRFDYVAEVSVPDNLLAVMSATNPKEKNSSGVYHFIMEKPVPSYLMALAVGDIGYKAIDNRTGVYASPHLLEKAFNEFQDIPKMVAAAEALYGPYVWGQYDVLVLPPAFPFGGMENPRLTFATPTILAGDKSLVSLIAHELAHSWSGNLVTNATWDDFWLNEGFTVYFELRIMEKVAGVEYAEMLASLNRQDLDTTLREIAASEDPDDSKLKLNLKGRNPDDGMTDIAYNKGYFLLRWLEKKVGREKFDAFLKSYFTDFGFKPMDTEKFKSILLERLPELQSASAAIDQWIYHEGLPADCPLVQSEKLAQADKMRMEWEQGSVKTKDLPWQDWAYQQRYRFLSNLSNQIDAQRLREFNAVWKVSETGNNEVLFAWLNQAVMKKEEDSYPRLESFLMEIGRRKFVAPLYTALVKTGQIQLARDIYSKARPNYHAVTRATIDDVLKVTSRN